MNKKQRVYLFAVCAAASFIAVCLLVNSCEDRMTNRLIIEPVKKMDAVQTAHDIGKGYRSIKDAFLKGYRDTTTTDTTKK